MSSAKRNHSSSESMDILVLIKQSPIKPADLVVLAVGIVVASLASTELIATKQHRNPARDEECHQEILDHAITHALDCRILARAFYPAIVAVVDVGSISTG